MENYLQDIKFHVKCTGERQAREKIVLEIDLLQAKYLPFSLLDYKRVYGARKTELNFYIVHVTYFIWC